MYGKCDECSAPLVPVWFTEKEYVDGIWTGRARKACSHLICEHCGKTYIVDDSFDQQWHR